MEKRQKLKLEPKCTKQIYHLNTQPVTCHSNPRTNCITISSPSWSLIQQQSRGTHCMVFLVFSLNTTSHIFQVLAGWRVWEFQSLFQFHQDLSCVKMLLSSGWCAQPFPACHLHTKFTMINQQFEQNHHSLLKYKLTTVQRQLHSKR